MKKSKPTRLDFAIMGLLLGGPLSGYQIRQIFETSDMANYSSSPGSIYPALKRLDRLHFLELVDQEEEKGKVKKRFQLTLKGKACFQNWLEEQVKKEDVYKRMDDLLLKFAFMDQLLSREKQVHFLQQIAKVLVVKIKDMQAFRDNRLEEIPLNGRLAFLHGIEIYQSHYRWVLEAKKVIEKMITSNQ